MLPRRNRGHLVTGLSAGRGAHAGLAPARVGIGGVRSLRGRTNLDRPVVHRRRVASWRSLGGGASGRGRGGVHGRSSGRGSSRSAARRSSAWPVAHMSIHNVLTVPAYASNAIRTTDTPACGRVVFWYKRLSFLWVVAAPGYACILSLVRQDQGSLRPPVLRTCPLAKEKKKIPLWPSAGPMVR